MVAKLHMVARYWDIRSWTRCKNLIGTLLDLQDLLVTRDDIFLEIFVAYIMKESLFSDNKIFLTDIFENLIFQLTVPAAYTW